jgi:hypothetical protein
MSRARCRLLSVWLQPNYPPRRKSDRECSASSLRSKSPGADLILSKSVIPVTTSRLAESKRLNWLQIAAKCLLAVTSCENLRQSKLCPRTARLLGAKGAAAMKADVILEKAVTAWVISLGTWLAISFADPVIRGRWLGFLAGHLELPVWAAALTAAIVVVLALIIVKGPHGVFSSRRRSRARRSPSLRRPPGKPQRPRRPDRPARRSRIRRVA